MSRKIIIADESIIIQKTAELVLSGKDYDLEFIPDGEEALRMIKDMVPDVVLADVDLPDMNGYKLCLAVKKDSALKDIQVILLVPEVGGIDEEKYKESGADDYIIKPFEPDELLSRLETAKASKDIIAELKEETVRLRKELKLAEVSADKKKNELLSKIEAANDSEEVVSRYKKEIHQTDDKIEILNNDILNKTDIIKSLEESVAGLKETLKQTEDKYSGLSDELSKERNASKKLDDMVADLRDRLKQAEEKSKQFNVELLSRTDDFSLSENIIADLKDKLKKAEDDGSRNREMINNILTKTIPEVSKEVKEALRKSIDDTIPTITKILTEKIENINKEESE
ncbi:MAG TPA: response regulator [Nitrospirae bacterium]|nr:response regulator [Nitrospirota bacterium]